MDSYVATGVLQIVARPLLQSGQISLQAAHAAECAGEQNQYFAMRHAIYANVGQLYMAPDMNTLLVTLADTLALDTSAFTSCMASERYNQTLYEGHARAENAGIVTRPVFEINGQRIIGARSFDEFATLIDTIAP